jgi:hypothetical protein
MKHICEVCGKEYTCLLKHCDLPIRYGWCSIECWEIQSYRGDSPNGCVAIVDEEALEGYL